MCAALRALVLLADSTLLCLLFLLSAYHSIFLDLLARFTLIVVYCSPLRITITFFACTYTISIGMSAYITVTITQTIFTLCHLLFPQFHRSTYQYLLFSIYYYLLHSSLLSVPSNQMELHL